MPLCLPVLCSFAQRPFRQHKAAVRKHFPYIYFQALSWYNHTIIEPAYERRMTMEDREKPMEGEIESMGKGDKDNDKEVIVNAGA